MNVDIPEKYHQHLRVGTCSWKYDTWKGLVYEPGTRYHADDYLVDYSRFFNTVEVDQWFWSLFPGEVKLPAEKAVSTYAASVPADFVFSVKAPNAVTLTHFYAKQPAKFREFANRPNEHFLDASIVEQFLESLEPLHSRLGPIMFQFEYLNEQKMPSRAEFLDKLGAFLGRLPSGFQYAVETRNKNCLCDEFFDLLRSLKVGTVLLDGYFMPPPSRIINRFDTRTADFAIIRLHGPDRAGIEKRTNKDWSQIVEPQQGGIDTAVEFVRRNSTDFITTYVNVNNHYEGSAPLSIERFLNELRKEAPK